MKKDYYLGFDIGTNSVGWAVTDESYELCKFKSKAMWGIRLFESANTAQDRRIIRNSRRRLERRKQRLELLQEIFAEEIAKIDSTFFIRLNESRLHFDDKSVKQKHPLFMDENYTDLQYYDEYPTIFHLRKELIESDKPHDIRLVYLALHNIIKHRGHFLIDGDLSATQNFEATFENVFNNLVEELELNANINKADIAEIENILLDKNAARSAKQKDIKKILTIEKSELTDEESKRQDNVIAEFCKFIVGVKGDITKLFNVDKDAVTQSKFSFRDSTYEAIRLKLDDEIPEYCYLLDMIKSICDWSILADILQNEKYISCASVKQYDFHHSNLAIFRKLVKKYCDKSEYDKFFNSYSDLLKEKGDKKNNFKSYADHVGVLKIKGKKYAVKKCSDEDFYKSVKSLLNGIKERGVELEDESVLAELIKFSELENMFPIQRSRYNASIPNQVNEIELKSILFNAKAYLPFLCEKDIDGISNIEKIEKIFKYRIPYYVGPLSTRHKDSGSNSWIVRKEGQNGKILPWNIEKIVDFEKSNEAFINRMTNKCTYIIGEDVLPKNSLLYTKFMVLNEINNLCVRGYKISVSQKQEIFNELFKTKAKVTGKLLYNYFKTGIPELELSDIKGIDGDCNTSLKSYMDFNKNVFVGRMDDVALEQFVEDVIRWKTIYGDDKKMLTNAIEANYKGFVDDKQLKNILSFRYRDWGNFSEKFLRGIEGVNKETGEVFTIIDALWETNNNLMQLLSSAFTFSEEIDKVNKDKFGEINSVTYDNVVKDMYVSPSVKRAIWQTVQISEEVKKVMGCEPKRIFVEMARDTQDNGKKNKKTKSRKDQLKEIFNAYEKDLREYWSKELDKFDERALRSKKLFLYFLQRGKCMYTGEAVDLDMLLSGSPYWDKDHIYPQSKILKDDSLDNLSLVTSKANKEKGDRPLSFEVQNRMRGFWKELLDTNAISKEKYDRLTRRGEFTEEQLTGFISRQLVETRQASKAVANAFKMIYTNSDIVYVKAGLVSDFRSRQLKVIKSRLVNDYHHAKDAYLNIVVGNVYNAKFTSNPIAWIKAHRNKDYSLNKVFNFDVYRGNDLVWKKPVNSDAKDELLVGGTIDTVRATVMKDNVLYTEYSYCEKGKLYDATIQKKTESPKIPIKAGLDMSKYGGYNGASTSYFMLVEYLDKKKICRKVLGVPIYVANMLEHNPDAIMEYCTNTLGLKDVRVLHQKIKKNTLLVVEGYPMRIRGENDTNIMLKNNLQLKVDEHSYKTIHAVEKFIDKNSEYEADEKFDRITDGELVKVYDVFLEKLNTLYRNRPSNKYNMLNEQRDIFITQKSLTEKIKIISEIIKFLRCDIATSSDLSYLGGGKTVGKMDVNKNTLSAQKIILVNQSVTGLFENRVEL